MKLINVINNVAVIDLTEDETLIIKQSLNELLNGLHFEDKEFALKTGYQRRKMALLLYKIHEVIRNGSNSVNDKDEHGEGTERFNGISKRRNTLEFTKEEILMIISALNEICYGNHFDYYEFQTRLGFYHEEVSSLLDAVRKIVEGHRIFKNFDDLK